LPFEKFLNLFLKALFSDKLRAVIFGPFIKPRLKLGCGCGVRSQFIRKTHLATEQCPLNPPKWSKYPDAGLEHQNF
jgi:hypothetical protein